MNPHIIAAEIARIVPELARDTYQNRADFIERKLVEWIKAEYKKIDDWNNSNPFPKGRWV